MTIKEIEDKATVVRFEPKVARPASTQVPDQEAQAPTKLDPKAPMDTARKFVTKTFFRENSRLLQHQNDTFCWWNGTHYPELQDADIRARLYKFLEKAVRITRKGDETPFNPNRNRLGDALDALKAVCNLPADIQAPAWLGDDDHRFPANEIIACANGLLHLKSRTLLPLTPQFFTPNALTFGYDPHAPKPVHWLKFLGDLWPEDEESINTLQEIFGYVLTADTAQQKAFLIVGPKRSGKGTIARILTALIGPDNVVAPTLSSLSTNFGLSPLIDKRLAIIGDARLSGKADSQVIAERILSITGEDGHTIDRKYHQAWNGRLRTRFLILSNELPRLSDASGALASRFIVLTLTRSFFGVEDLGLFDSLSPELPGILNWAIEGWGRLFERGYFLQPQSSADAIQELEDMGSPISAFVRDCCVVNPSQTVPKSALFEAWQAWCQTQGREHAGTAAVFGRDLRAAYPALNSGQWTDDCGKRHHVYNGIGLA